MNFIKSAKDYFVGSYSEMKKVNWPSKKQTINYSTLVIGISVGMAVFFSLLDYIFNWGIQKMFLR